MGAWLNTTWLWMRRGFKATSSARRFHSFRNRVKARRAGRARSEREHPHPSPLNPCARTPRLSRGMRRLRGVWKVLNIICEDSCFYLLDSRLCLQCLW